MILSGGGELHVAGGVQCSLHRVLDHADDEADTDHLHGHIVGDAKQGAGHGDEQQRAAGHAGSAAGAQSGHSAQDDGGGQGHGDAQRVGRSQRHDGDGDSRTIHIDGSAQRDGDGIHILIEAQLLAQGHVDGDVGRRAAGEESGQAGLLQATEHQRIRVAAQIEEHDEGRNNERHEEHGTHQQGQQLAVLGEDGQTVAGHVGVHQTHDAEGSQIDDPAHHLRHSVGSVGKELLGGVRADVLHGKAEHAGPEQDADVVAAHQRADRVGDEVGEQGAQHLAQTLRHHVRLSSVCQNDRHREHEAGDRSDRRRKEGGEHVQPDDRTEAAVQLGAALCQRARHDDEHQHRSDALQCADEQAAQLTDPACTRHRKRQHRADDQTDDDAKDEADLIVLLRNGFCTIHHIKHSSVFVRPRRTVFLSLTQRQLLL